MNHYKLTKLANYLIKIALNLKPVNLKLKKELIRRRGKEIVKNLQRSRNLETSSKPKLERDSNFVRQLLWRSKHPKQGKYSKLEFGKKKQHTPTSTPPTSTSSGSDILPIIGLGGLLGYVGLKASNKRRRK
jgi:hypothetical protein